MNYRQKILLDRTFGIPAAVCLDQILLLERRIFPHRTQIPHTPKTILISKIVGMGSAIQATPALNAIREAHPNAKICFLTAEANEAIIKRFPCIDEIVTINDRSVKTLAISTLKAIAKIRRLKPDIFIDLEVYSSLTSLLGTTFGAKQRIGFYRKSCAFKEGIFTDLIFFNTRVPVWQLYHQIARVAGAKPHEGEPQLGPIEIYPEEEKSSQDKIRELTQWGNPQYLVINTNASDLLLERRWPIEKFITLIDALNAQGYQILLTGSPAEAQYVETTLKQVANQNLTFNVAGKLSLGEFLAVVKNAQAVITNDTGPMHIACALGTPTVALFGPGDPNHYTLPAPNTLTISHPVVCGPCLYHSDVPPCRGRNICMEKITVQEVISGLETLLKNQPLEKKPQRKIEVSNPDQTLLGHFKQTPMKIPIRNTKRFVEINPKNFHGVTEPQPTDEELNAIYSESYYNAWGFKENPEEVSKLKTHTARLALAPIPPSGKILDCGAAHGVLLKEAKTLGLEPYAIERNPSTAEALQALFGADRIYTGLFEDASFPQLENRGVGQFEAITMCDFIEHVRNPSSVLKKASELLKPGGKLVITTPRMDSLSAKIMGENWPHFKEEHLNYFSAQSIRETLETVGLKTDSITNSKKCLSLDYLHRQFRTYGPKIAALGTGALFHTLTGQRHRPLLLSCGEMMVVATKKS